MPPLENNELPVVYTNFPARLRLPARMAMTDNPAVSPLHPLHPPAVPRTRVVRILSALSGYSKDAQNNQVQRLTDLTPAYTWFTRAGGAHGSRSMIYDPQPGCRGCIREG